jgi:ATP synthase protein I
MQSNDVRTLLNCTVPTAAAGVIATVAGGAVAGGKGAIGAAAGALVVIAFMATGMVVLQRTAVKYPSLFQMMGLVLYTAQILLLAIVLAVFRHTSLFNTRAFALSLLAAALVWIAAQARSYMKTKILYVEPQPAAGSPS